MAIVKISDLPLVDSPVEGTDLFVVVQDNVTKKAYASDIQTYVGFEEVQYATAGQTVFNLTTMTYAAGANNLMVFVDGVNQYEGSSYIETDNNTVTFTQGLHVGALVKFSTVQTQTSLVNSAGAVTFTAAGAGAVPTNVQARLRQTISVKDFGAVGDGVTDDTADIQAAITAANASGGSVVFLPAGTYQLSSRLNLASNVQLVGAGMGITILRMAATSTADSVIYGTGLSNVRVADLSVDVNGSARSAYAGTMSGVLISISTNVTLFNIEVYGALGSTAPASAFAVALAQVTRGLIFGCVARDSGTASRAADAFYCGPNEQTLIEGCVALNCTDSGFVLESCNASGIVGCTSKGCRVGAAISAAFNGDCYGNYIDGLTVYDWDSTVSGGLYVRTTGTGSLYDTKISNVIMRRISGAGPAVQIYNVSASTAVIENVTLSNVTVHGAGTQGFLVSGASGRPTRYVVLNGCQVFGTVGASAVQIQSTCADVRVMSCVLSYAASAASIGVLITNGVRCSVESCRILGDSTNVTYGVFFSGTNTNCAVVSSSIDAVTVSRVGADSPSTVQVALWLDDGTTGRLQIGANTVLRERLAAVPVVTGTAGGTYTATEQTLINNLKTAVNSVIARLDSATGHGLIT